MLQGAARSVALLLDRRGDPPASLGDSRRLLPVGDERRCRVRRERLTGRVVRAVDGDTLEVAIDGGPTETVRVIGVDTPETVKPDTPVQCFGPQASAFEHRHVEGRRVRLLVGVEPRDVYGRLLAYVWVAGRRAGPLPRGDAAAPRPRPHPHLPSKRPFRAQVRRA